MSEWRLGWVKTRTIQGLSGAYEEVTAWKPVPYADKKVVAYKYDDGVAGLILEGGTEPEALVRWPSDPDDTLKR